MKTDKVEQSIENLIKEAQQKINRAKLQEDWATVLRTEGYMSGLNMTLQIIVLEK